ncbi:MAG: FprA family A-type flavoprotein, partial [Chloroflexi bacterium]|nr:FprA family A-type flavoprotein [Chloroflexota bacterium]
MLPVEIKPGITWVGVNDRITELFEGLWTIRQEGVSYNSYLIR